jgi:gliding motility-associated-like protein
MIHYLKVIVCSVFIFMMFSAAAQNVLDNKVYRVTAYKRGNNLITSTSNYAEVIPPLSVYIPSAFTPNGDGLNDTFGIKGEGIRDYHIYIYNRWGEVVFESSNPRQQWDGIYQGNPAEQGCYVYKVYANGFDGKGKTGMVTLLY